MRQALGKGIGALIPTASPRRSAASIPIPGPAGDTSVSEQNAVRNIAVDDVDLNPRQPRSHFDDHALDELARSISESGVLQPILVRRADVGRYQLIAGERRLRACRQAGLTTVPALVLSNNRRILRSFCGSKSGAACWKSASGITKV